MNEYNATAHNPASIRGMLVAACQNDKRIPVNGAYRIKRGIAINYLQSFFKNLAFGTIMVLLDTMIIEGTLDSECENERYYVRVPFDENKFVCLKNPDN